MPDFGNQGESDLWDALASAALEDRVDLLMELARRAFDERAYARAGDLAGQAASEAEAVMSSSQVEDCRHLEGRCRAMADSTEEALSAYRAGIDAYVAPDPTVSLARNYWGTADVLFQKAMYVEAAQAARQSVDAALSAEDFGLAGLSALLQSRALYLGDFEEEALETCGIARNYYREVPSPRRVTDVDDFAATVLLFLGRNEEAADHLERCLTMARTAGNEGDIAYAQYRLAQARTQQGEEESALRLLEEAGAIYQQLGELADVAQCASATTRSLERLGRVVDAIDSARTASTLWDALGREYDYLRMQGFLSRLLYAQGQFNDAIRVNQRIIAASHGSANEDIQSQGGWALLRMADNHLALESWAQVLSVLDGDTYWTGSEETSGRLWMATMRARALFALGKSEEALGVADSALAATEDGDVNSNTAYLYEIKARVGLAQMRPDRERHLTHAIALHLAVGEDDVARDLADYFRPSFSHGAQVDFDELGGPKVSNSPPVGYSPGPAQAT